MYQDNLQVQKTVNPFTFFEYMKTIVFVPKVLGKAFVLEQLTAYISFTNPLPVPLTGGVFTLEGAGLLSDTQIYVE